MKKQIIFFIVMASLIYSGLFAQSPRYRSYPARDPGAHTPGSPETSQAADVQVAEVQHAVPESGYLPGVPGSPDHLHSRYLLNER